jgi:hypothetical protein
VFLEIASSVFAAGCAWASARRLALAVAPTALDHGLVLAAVEARGGDGSLAGVRRALAGESVWEGDLLDAVTEPDERTRDARLNEQLSEFDRLAGRWANVPRVCARLATSVGFLCACVALLQGLSLSADEASPEALHQALMSALSCLSAGIAGTAFCAAVHFRARRVTAERAVAVDRLVQGLLSVSRA